MFTGIVEEIGMVKQIKHGRNSSRLHILAENVLNGTEVGDSIAVNGICLTVTERSSDYFAADVMHETLNRSALASLTCGASVNLERAMPANGRFGGHIVSGHVDGVGEIIRIRRDDNAIWYTIQTEQKIMRYVVEKGSIAIDGISLTIAEVNQADFSVSAIPHTVNQTVLKKRQEGDFVNLETDMLGKYIEKLLSPIYRQQRESVITKEFLTQHGF